MLYIVGLFSVSVDYYTRSATRHTKLESLSVKRSKDNSVFNQISAISLKLSRSIYHAEAEIRPHHWTLRDDLNWLSITQRIMYKLCIIVYKCVHGAAPSHLAEMCIPILSLPALAVVASAQHRMEI